MYLSPSLRETSSRSEKVAEENKRRENCFGKNSCMYV